MEQAAGGRFRCLDAEDLSHRAEHGHSTGLVIWREGAKVLNQGRLFRGQVLGQKRLVRIGHGGSFRWVGSAEVNFGVFGYLVILLAVVTGVFAASRIVDEPLLRSVTVRALDVGDVGHDHRGLGLVTHLRRFSCERLRRCSAIAGSARLRPVALLAPWPKIGVRAGP